MARFLVFSLSVLALLGCQKGSSDRVTIDLATKSTGTPVARFNGGTITVEDLNRQLANLPPMVRLRLQGSGPKKDFVEGQVRVELLAREAVRNGLQNDPEVVEIFKKTLAQKALQQALEKGAPQPTDDELKAWYESHQADFQRPEMVQVQDIFLSADSHDAARRKSRLAEAEKLRAKARALKPDDEAGFAALVKASSDDALTKPAGGDLRPMPLPDLTARYGAEVGDAAKALQTDGEISPVVTTEKGFYILRLKARTPAHTLPLDEVKAQIRNRLSSERRTAASDALLARLKTESGYTLDEAALAQVSVPSPGTPGMPGAHGGMPGNARDAAWAPAEPGVSWCTRRASTDPMSRARACRAACLVLLLAGCHRRPPEDPSATPVAWVNGQAMARAEFERELARSLEPADGTSAPAPDQLSALRRTVLQARLDQLLFLQEAKRRGLEIAPGDVEQRLQRMRADWPPDEFEALLAQRHQTLDELRAELRAQLVQERLFHELVYPRVAVTEEEIRTELEAHPELLQEPEQVHAAQIVVKELDQAKEIRNKLRDGARFADLARERSLSADAKDGGDLGWFPRGVMPPQFDAVAFSLGPGQISEVVTTDYGFHVFKVLERRPARKKDLGSVRAEVERRLLRAKQEQAQTEFVNQLRSKADVRIDEALVAQVVPRAPAPAPQETHR